MTDAQNLLAEYVRTGSDTAFRELVTRYVDLVYSTALRLVNGNTHRAEDVAQTVFVDLVRKARTLPADVMLGGWLHRHTCFVAANIMRGERRRQFREREAVEMNTLQDDSGTDFSLVAPVLDETINQLNEEDRTAIVLRFFEQRDFRSVGVALGSNEDAARMRVNRALEKLRALLLDRGITTGAAALGIALSAQAVHAAPAGLAAAISTAAALAGTTASTAVAATKVIAMTTMQKSIIGAALIAAVGTGIYGVRQVSQLRDQNQRLQQQQLSLAEQLRQLAQEHDEATNQLARLLAQDQMLQSNSNEDELLKLRAEVTRLQQMNAAAPENSREAIIKSWLERRDKLKQIVEQNPDKSIPEFQLLSEQQWLDAAMDARFDTDKEIQQDLANLRHTAENNFVAQLHGALQKYEKSNHNQFPTDLFQLQPYFETPVDPAILNRWKIVPQSDLPNQNMGGDWVITGKSPVDRSLDLRWAIGPGGYGDTSYPKPGVDVLAAVLQPAIKAYAAANNGQQPTEPSQLQPYLTTPEQQSAFQKLVQMKDSATNSGTK